MALRWTSALSIGVAELDRQHQELFEHVDRLHGAILRRDRAEAARTLRFLDAYVHVHFSAEEALMDALAYPARAAHRAEHGAFAATVTELSRVLERDGATAALVHRVDREVTAWLADHIYTTDLALGWYVRGRQAAEAR